MGVAGRRPGGGTTALVGAGSNSGRDQHPRSLELWLDVGHSGTLSLFKMNLGPKQERAKAEVGQGQHHVKVFVHVAMMQEVMAIQPEENS